MVYSDVGNIINNNLLTYIAQLSVYKQAVPILRCGFSFIWPLRDELLPFQYVLAHI